MRSSRPRRRRRKFLGVTNSDLAFTGKYAVQGNYNGFQVLDISNPAKPTLVLTYLCPASQSDVSVYKNLLFVSGEGQTGRLDCGIQGVPEPVSKDRLRGIRIFDISDIDKPEVRRQRADLPRLAHAHGRHRSEGQGERLHLCVGLVAASARPTSCPAARTAAIDDPNTARFRLEVIKVPLAAPEKAAIVSSPRIFQGLAPPPRRVEPGRGGRGRGDRRRPVRQARGRGARRRAEPQRPPRRRTGAAARRRRRGRPRRRPRRATTGPESVPRHHRLSRHRPRRRRLRRLRPAARHHATSRTRCASTRRPTSTCRSGTRRRSATTAPRSCSPTSGAAASQPRCRDTDKPEWGANALFTIENDKMQFKSYYKIRRRRRRSRTASRTTDRSSRSRAAR